MKLAIILSRFDPALGGLEHHANDWAHWLVARGHEVHIVAHEGIDPSDGIRLHPTGPRDDDVRVRAERLSAAATTLAPDIVHDFGAGLGGHILHPVGGSRAGATDGELRSLDWARRLKRRLSPRWRTHRARLREIERRQFEHPGGLIVACSDRVAGDLTKAGAPTARIRVVYNAVNERRFVPASPARKPALRQALGIPSDGTLFLQVAQNFRLKGVASSIRAMAVLTHQGIACRLAVAGRGPDLDRYRRLATGLGVADRCHLLGAITDTALLYAAADALVHPAFYDPCSLTCLEAWASGLPVALSIRDGASGLMTEGVQGWLIRDPADAGEIAFRLKELLDPGRREGMGAQARVLAEHNTADAGFSQLEALCREVAGSR